ncbi:MAG: polysaccharide pyruvyl transferase family protein [Solobacterium sp.]|nr:polysaccharide pyruvyl transferase family protein [Solobacterium sp.]
MDPWNSASFRTGGIGKKLIFDLTSREATVLCDPVFLLNKDEWIRLLSLKPHSGHYCLAYFLNEMSDNAKHMAEELSGKGYEIIYLPYQISKPAYTMMDAGPVEFLNLVLGAEIVLSDSFHALLFSLLFHRQFCAFRKPGSADTDQPLRLRTLLKRFGMEDRLDRSSADLPLFDEEAADRIIEEEKQKALAYLLSSLEAAEKE